MQNHAFKCLSIAIFPQGSGIPRAVHTAGLFGDPVARESKLALEIHEDVALRDGVEMRLPEIYGDYSLSDAIIDILLCVLHVAKRMFSASNGGVAA